MGKEKLYDNKRIAIIIISCLIGIAIPLILVLKEKGYISFLEIISTIISIIIIGITVSLVIRHANKED